MLKNKESKIIKNNTTRIIVIVLLFLLSAFLIIQTYPSLGKFIYSYELDKPWHHETLTAPFAFEINKSKNELKKEQDSLFAKQLNPCYNRDSSIKENNLASFMENSVSVIPTSEIYKEYISGKLNSLYDEGIVSITEMEKLQKDKKETVFLKDNKVVQKKPVAELNTIKTAYEKLINEAPLYLNKNTLRNFNITNYIQENLFFDEAGTENFKKDLLKEISLTKGRVQSGEKIIDHGDLVDASKYDILNSLKQVTLEKNGNSNSPNILIGQIIVVLGILCVYFLYLFLFRQKFLVHTKNVVFMLSIIVILCFFTSMVIKFDFSPYIIPYTILSIVISTFFDTRTALFSLITTVLLCSFIVPSEFDFLFLQITTGMVSICTLRNFFQRSQLVKSAGIIVLSYCILYTGYILIQEISFDQINWYSYLYFVANGALLLLAYPLIYIFEKIFGYISDVTLVELANTNNPLLRKFSEVAPGSFQHSMQVSNLAADAALAIDANPMLARTGALYHDIGKIMNPAFFTENQSAVNPHTELKDEEKSARIIIKHVEDGVSVAKKYNLPTLLQDFIRSHHGLNKTKYFYNSLKNKYPDKEIDSAKFTYPGPLPYTKEMAVVMMCDSVEAASRSLPEYTDKSINDLVDKIINELMDEGAFKEAPVTFKNIETVKTVLKEKLKNIYHTRISYPELIKKENEETNVGSEKV
jgi:putative nucleotidyltransferase with HDIG domain